MVNLAGGIADLGYPLDLVLARAEGPYLAQIPPSVRLVDLQASRALASLPALVRYLRRERPAAVLSALSRANLIALWSRRLAGFSGRVVVNEQDTLSHWARESSNWKHRVTPPLARYFYRGADQVVAVSQGVADDLIRIIGVPQQRVRVIFNPGVTPALRDKAQAPLEHEWFRPDQPPVILAVGRLSKQKDFATLLRAFARLRQSRTARLMILGEGPEREALEATRRELDLDADVAMPGFVANPYAYMTRADVFVLSSIHEGLPTVLVEALYCGVPIVSTDCPSGPREILKQGELGMLVPMASPVELSQALRLAIDGRSPRPTPESWRPYALDTIANRYVEALLGEAVSGRTPVGHQP